MDTQSTDTDVDFERNMNSDIELIGKAAHHESTDADADDESTDSGEREQFFDSSEDNEATYANDESTDSGGDDEVEKCLANGWTHDDANADSVDLSCGESSNADGEDMTSCVDMRSEYSCVAMPAAAAEDAIDTLDLSSKLDAGDKEIPKMQDRSDEEYPLSRGGRPLISHANSVRGGGDDDGHHRATGKHDQTHGSVESDEGWEAAMVLEDQWGAPKGLQGHLDFARSVGLPLAVSEWSGNAEEGDMPVFVRRMHDFFARHGGTGAGQVLYEVQFNVIMNGTDVPDQWLLVSPATRMPESQAMYTSLDW